MFVAKSFLGWVGSDLIDIREQDFAALNLKMLFKDVLFGLHLL